jgi:hypothetical protein
MFTQRDSKLWKAYCHKLLELGITDIGPQSTEGKAYLYEAKYGDVPVLIEYNLWSRMSPGWVSVSYVTEHSVRLMFKLSSERIVLGAAGRPVDATGVRVQCFLLG